MPKADATEKPVKAAPVTKNAQLDLPGVNPASSQDLFGELDEQVEYIRALFYGHEGSGKTTSLASLANTGRILIINAEGGLKKQALAKRGVNVSNIKTWPRPGQAITAAGLDEVYYSVKRDLAADPNSWAGIGFDSATDIVQALTDQVSTARIRRARAKGFEIEEVDEYFTDVADYGTMGKMFVDKLRKFRDLPTHIVITALERRTVDKKTSEVALGPAVTPGVAVPLLGYVDIVMAFKAADEDQPFRALTAPLGNYRAKDRLGVLPKVMVEPSMERIIAYANGEFEGVPDPLQATLPAPKPTGKKATKTRGKKEESSDSPAPEETSSPEEETPADEEA